MVLASGCVTGSIEPSMRYSSWHNSDRMPVIADVEAEVQSLNTNEGTPPSDADRRLMSATLRDAIRQDIEKNGPFSTDAGQPRVKLKVVLDVIVSGDTTAWRSIPPWLWWLFGLPTYSRSFEVTATATVFDASGQSIAETTERESCTKYSGLYYNWSVDYACAVESVMEAVRDKLATFRETVVARAGAPRPSEAAPAAAPSQPSADRSKTIVAVFDIEDATTRLAPDVKSQLSEYVATKVTEALGYRVVPRDQLRARLQDEKKKGYQACFEESCQIELGKALAAEKSLATKILRVGKKCTVTATVFDLKTETTERAASKKSECEEDALMGAIDEVMRELSR
jgi:hypothetical protein